MRRALSHAPAAEWPAGAATDSVTLDFDGRHRRRVALVTNGGAEVLLDLPTAVAMADGDGLKCDDGGWIAVRAAAEPLIEIRCGDAHALARIAWHLGNRHLPTDIGDGRILIRPDHVIEDMVRGLGAATKRIEAPFQPEGGAYADGHHGHHDHS